MCMENHIFIYRENLDACLDVCQVNWFLVILCFGLVRNLSLSAKRKVHEIIAASESYKSTCSHEQLYNSFPYLPPSLLSDVLFYPYLGLHVIINLHIERLIQSFQHACTSCVHAIECLKLHSYPKPPAAVQL